MTQKIYFVGGGDITEGELIEIDQKAINDSKTKSLYVLDLTTQDPIKLEKYRNFMKTYFSKLGILNIDFISLSKSKKEIEENFKKSDILYIPGGDTETLLNNLIKKDIPKLIKSFNGIILGNSAGALVLCKKTLITKDEKNSETKILKGLGLVPFSVEVHYDSSQDEELSKIDPKIEIYAIAERSALIWNNTKIETIGSVIHFKR
jgi:peptidase E